MFHSRFNFVKTILNHENICYDSFCQHNFDPLFDTMSHTEGSGPPGSTSKVCIYTNIYIYIFINVGMYLSRYVSMYSHKHKNRYAYMHALELQYESVTCKIKGAMLTLLYLDFVFDCFTCGVHIRLQMISLL